MKKELVEVFDIPEQWIRTRPDGQPDKYDPKKFQKLLHSLCEGTPLTQAAREYGITHRTVNYWRAREPKIAEAIRVAREIGEDAIADQCLEIADNIDEAPESRKVRVWTRLQLLTKWNPKKWQEKLHVDVSHDFTKVLEEARERSVISTQ